MSEFIINGGKKLNGEIKISGSKNAALPIIAATLLNKNKITLYNVPDIEDVNTTIKILRIIGCQIIKKCDRIEISCEKIKSTEIPKELMKKSRSTVIIAGALIGRFKNATFSYPGGCNIGARPIDLHIAAFKDLGIKVIENDNKIQCSANKIKGTKIYLKFPSVGATENTILASVLAEGVTTIYNAAKEPEIKDLVTFLNKSGAKIYGAGTSKIKIIGVENLHKVTYRIMPDRIETGTYLCMGAITKGFVKLNNTNPLDLLNVLYKLKEIGCKIEFNNNSITLIAPNKLKSIKNISTEIYPGFPTDLQPIFTAILCVADGKSKIRENIFENRFGFCEELNKMGAKIKICDEKVQNNKIKNEECIDKKQKCIEIVGVKSLNGADVVCNDLRGGASLITASLIAKGKTRVLNAQNVLRGYEDIDKKLKKLGADIEFCK